MMLKVKTAFFVISFLCLFVLQLGTSWAHSIPGPEADRHNTVYSYNISEVALDASKQLHVTINVYMCPYCSPYNNYVKVNVVGIGTKYTRNTPVGTTCTRSFIFDASSLKVGDIVQIKSDVWCEWCGHWRDSKTFKVEQKIVEMPGLGYKCNMTLVEIGSFVNVANGNLFYSRQVSPNPKLPLTLNYNSRSNRQSRFGFGWNDSADIRLVRKTDGTIILIDADGREEKFSSNANGTFSSPPGNHDSLKLNKQVLFSDDMENGNGSWAADDPWGQVTSRSHSSNTSWTDSPNANYSNSVHKALTLELDLSNTAVASMTFWHTFALENGYDFGYIEISKDGGANWTLLKSYTGYQNDWAKQTVSLNSYAGLSNLLLRFRLITDSSVTYDGWYIDDVEISGGSSYQLYRKRGSIVCFDQDGKPYRIEDRNGNAIIYTYDEDKLSAITGPDGDVLYISNDSNGRITQISDATGRVTSFTYDADNNLTSITNAAGDTWKFAYDGVHNMIAKTDPQGQTTQYSYDSDDRLLGSTDAAGNNRTVEYVSDAVTRVTDPAGNTSEYTYNNSLNVIRKVDALGNITEYTWDADLNKISVTDASGTITYSYDSFGNMLSRTDQSGSTTSYTYDAFGNILTITDAQGNVISNTYDEKGNLISTTDPAGNTTTYQYDAKGRIISVTDANKRVTTFGYDAAGNLITITDPIGATITMTYDAAGNMVTMTDPTGNITTFTYDVLNRLITITDAKGNVTTYGYDKLGNRASITDANGNTTLFTYDHKGRVTKIVNALGHLTVFTYTDAGCPSCSDTGKNSPTSITDANEQTTIFKYDALGRLIQESDPLGKWVSYTYDAQGNLISRLDAKGERTSYTYDALGRLLSITYPDDSTTSFSYDVKGNVITASNQHIGYAMEYDKLGRLTRITDSYDRTISYKYDALGNRVQMTMPDGELVTYEYDKANRLSKTVGFAGSFGLDYDELGRRTSLRYPNGVTTSYTYDTVGRLVDLLTKNAKGDILSAFSYTHDKVGNRLTKTESYKHHHHKHKRYEYTYDSIYRLLESMPVTIKKHK
ncbi:hypothetical protein KFV02_09780, partial [Desulfohalobiaceae bacterium Ax17]|uniref:DUF6531 domain-containing protein n=1 Tax=Desulfovulcanus ferrireducens TaxID=2831190 RepID=UPI00207BBEC4